jgi:hypothetical protein
MQKLHKSTTGDLGRLAGTLARHLRWLNDQIDWAEVAQIVIQGLKVLVVLALLAGRGARRLWDGLPGFSERLGKAYAALLVPSTPPAPLPALPLVPQLEQLAAAARALLADWIAERRQSLEAYLAMA